MSIKTTKLKILYERAQRDFLESEKEFSIAHQQHSTVEVVRNAAYWAWDDAMRSEGWCVSCDKPVTECPGHIGIAI